SLANAWAAAMIGSGAVLGYFFGFLDLPYLFPELGVSYQLEALCMVAACVFAASVIWTCLWTRDTSAAASTTTMTTTMAWYHPLIGAFRAGRHLPPRIQHICTAQFFAWMAWFPFLFYSTTWIMEVLLRTHSPKEPGFPDAAVRTGSLAL